MSETLLNFEVGRAFYGRFIDLLPSQRETIEPIIAGRDVLVLARTGSGKTEAVLAPLVQRWLPDMRRTTTNCTLIYIVPTRALANDLLRRIQPVMESLGLMVGARHGERNDLTRVKKPSLLITTPETLDVLLTRRDESLRFVRGVVLDEIHLTYNTQRGFQLAVLLKRLDIFTGTACQVVGLSATVGAPTDIWSFFRPCREVVTVHDEQTKPLNVQIREVPSDQQLINIFDNLSKHSGAKIMLFANSRRECDRLSDVLRGRTGFGDNVFVHYSSLSPDVRLDVEQRFQEGPTGVCVATTTLELGIDIGDIDLVALYDPPYGWESFLQRVGRGSRQLEKTNVLCLVASHEGSRFQKILAFKALLAQIQSGRLERERPLDIYGAAAQQLLVAILERKGKFIRLLDLAELFSGWPHLDVDVIGSILEGLVESGHLIPHGYKRRFGPAEELHRLEDFRLIWGNFSQGSTTVPLVSRGRQIGSVPFANLGRLSTGAVLRFLGRRWKVRSIQSQSINVEPSNEQVNVEIIFGGAKVTMDPTIVEETLRLVEAGIDNSGVKVNTSEDFIATVERMRPYIGWEKLPVAKDNKKLHYYCTFGGCLLDEVIARWAGVDSYEAGEYVLRTDRSIDFSSLPDDLSALAEQAVAALTVPMKLTLFQNLLPAKILLSELSEVWLKTPVYERALERLRSAQLTAVSLEGLAPLCD